MRAALTSTLLLGLLLVTACDGASGSEADGGRETGDPTTASATAEGSLPKVRRLVTLGDSFTSGAGVPTIDTSNGCQRSDHDYGALAAAELGARYVDVSCGSATTANAGVPQVTAVDTVPPQLDGVDPRADVVTVSLGLNDLLFFTDMVFTCTSIAATQPQGTPCQDAFAAAPNGGPVDRLPQIAKNITGVLSFVKAKAPDATVLLVGYPQLVPEDGTCPELPLPAEEYPYFRGAFEGLADTMRQVADDMDVTFVDVLGPSAGHDICAGEDAWVLGKDDRPGAGIAYHPLLVETQAVADLVLDALRS